MKELIEILKNLVAEMEKGGPGSGPREGQKNRLGTGSNSGGWSQSKTQEYRDNVKDATMIANANKFKVISSTLNGNNNIVLNTDVGKLILRNNGLKDKYLEHNITHKKFTII